MKTPLAAVNPFIGFDLLPGTYGVTRISGAVGVVVRFGEYLVDGNADWSHAFVLAEQLADGDWAIIEAEPGGAKIGRLSEYANKPVAFNDQHHLSPAERVKIVDEATALVGYGYNWLDYASIAVTRMLGVDGDAYSAHNRFVRWLRARLERPDRLICSQLVDVVYCLAGIHLFSDRRAPGDVTPGDLADIITRHLWTRPGDMHLIDTPTKPT